MRDNITKKIVSVLMLMTFLCSNTPLLAMESMPVLRTDEVDAIALKANSSITDSDEKITLSLRDSDVQEVLRLFADKAGLNIIFSGSISGKVTLDLVNVSLNEAFELVLSTSNLTYLLENNTLIIAASGTEINSSNQNISIVPVKYIDASVMADFLNKNIFAKKKTGLSSTEIVTVNPMTNELLVFGNPNDVAISRRIVEKFDKKPLTTTVVVKHTTPEEMANMVCDMLLPAASGSTGGAASITGGAASISGVMTGAASSSSSIQIGGGEVACTIESKSGGEVSPMSLQSLAISYLTQAGTISIIGGSQQQVEMIKEFIADNDKKQPQAYLEVSFIELSEDGSKNFTNTWQYVSKHFSFNASSGTIKNADYPIFFIGDTIKPKEGDPIGKYQGSTALTYSINYALNNGKGRVVANPRIIITNGQEATIDLTDDYVQSVTSQVLSTGGGLAGAVQKTYNIASDNGIKVTVTPFISPDGYVTLDVKPDYTTIAERVTTLNPDTGENEIQATLLSKRNLDLKGIRIKDGETLVIGGMIKEDEHKTVQKIPFLGDIPGLGMLFRSSVTTKQKKEMLILLTPKIIVDSEDEVNQDEFTL